ncbi:hypothetical protein SOVF_164000 isoform B [Spinacia oleracea]|nr:hypothetical protein SOVF_164000 isoform B [Spinacia oleracea]
MNFMFPQITIISAVFVFPLPFNHFLVFLFGLPFFPSRSSLLLRLSDTKTQGSTSQVGYLTIQ